MAEVQTLNQYIGSDTLGNGTTIVAPSMEVACKVYQDQLSEDPVTMQCTKQNVRCVLPDVFVSFTAVVYDPTGVAAQTCSVTPEAYTLLAGTKQIFTAKAGEGWTFDKWRINGEDVEGEEGTKDVALLTIPTANAPILVEGVFKATV